MLQASKHFSSYLYINFFSKEYYIFNINYNKMSLFIAKAIQLCYT